MELDGRSCIFCNSGNLSKEHIYPCWLFGIFKPSQKTFSPSFHIIERSISNEESDKFIEDASDGRKINYENFTVRNVCEECNNGWMSKIESDVKKILANHINDAAEELVISPPEANTLSQWVVLKCMLTSLTLQQKVFFSKMSYTLIKNGIIPEGFIVEVTKMKHSLLNFMIGGPQIRKAFEIPREQLDLALKNFYKASLQIGYVGFRVSFLRTEIPVFRKQIQKRMFVLHPYNSKLPFEENLELKKEYESALELPMLNSFITIID